MSGLRSDLPRQQENPHKFKKTLLTEAVVPRDNSRSHGSSHNIRQPDCIADGMLRTPLSAATTCLPYAYLLGGHKADKRYTQRIAFEITSKYLRNASDSYQSPNSVNKGEE